MQRTITQDSTNFGNGTSKILLNNDGLAGCLSYLFDPSLSQTFEQWITNFDNNAIISLYLLPTNILSKISQRYTTLTGGSLAPLTSLRILDTSISIDRFAGSPLLYAIPPETTFDRLYGGSCYVKRVYNNYFDFSPYTTYQIKIPIVGTYTIPDICAGRYLDLFYTIDFDSMQITATVYCRKVDFYDASTGEQDESFEILKQSAPFGVNIPLNGEYKAQTMHSALTGAVGFVSDIALAGTTGGLSATKLAGDIDNTARPPRQLSTGVSSQGLNTFYDDLRPAVIITGPQIMDDIALDGLTKLKGRVLNQSFNLNVKLDTDEYMFEGYIEADDLYLEQDPSETAITDNELSEIKQLLRSGVFINRE